MEGINPLRDSAERLPAGAELCLLGCILWARVCSRGVPSLNPFVLSPSESVGKQHFPKPCQCELSGRASSALHCSPLGHPDQEMLPPPLLTTSQGKILFFPAV